MDTSYRWPIVCFLGLGVLITTFVVLNNAETKKTNELLKVVIRTQFQQHLDQTNLGDPAAVIRRFALGYTLQKEAKIWTDEEWNRIMNEDIPHYLQQHPKAITVWKTSLRRFWTADFVAFMDEKIAHIPAQ